MPLFDRDAENLRKQNLKIMEDKRLHFAAEMEKIGFMPERMLFCSSETGSFVALARWNGKIAIVTSPTFGQEGEFALELHDKLRYEKEEIFEKGTGLNGAFGFGTKGAKGFKLHISMHDGSVATLDVVAGRTSWMECCKARKNPLLSMKRRRSDANLLWDMMPIEPGQLSKLENALASYYLAE